MQVTEETARRALGAEKRGVSERRLIHVDRESVDEMVSALGSIEAEVASLGSIDLGIVELSRKLDRVIQLLERISRNTG